MNEGFIKLYKKIKNWEWYQNSYCFHIMIHLIISANYKDSGWQGIEVKRGQFITGHRKISKETGISSQSVRTCLNKLKSTNEITIKSTNKFSIITICNYDIYQDSIILTNPQTNPQTNKQLTNNQQTTNKQLTTTNKNKEIKERKEIREEGDTPSDLSNSNISEKEKSIQISEMFFRIYKEINYRDFILTEFLDRDFIILAKQNLSLKDYEIALRNGLNDDFHRNNISPRYLEKNINLLLHLNGKSKSNFLKNVKSENIEENIKSENTAKIQAMKLIKQNKEILK